MVTVRPARPEDADALARFLAGLSSDTAQRRFNAPLPRVSSPLLNHLLGTVEGVRAWVALDPDADTGAEAGGELVVGHAMVAATPDPQRVEFAVVVTDRWQHTGVGHLLAACAREAVRAQAPYDPVVELVVHPANRPALGWAVRMVDAARRCLERPEVRLSLVTLR
jgi:acetyltransferase